MSDHRLHELYDKLLSLPLFLGMTLHELQEAAGQAKLEFKKKEEGEMIVKEGERCNHVYFLLSGELYVETEADDHGYRVVEDIAAPEIFQAECLFGLNQRFTHTYIAKNTCSLLRIDKKDITKLSGNFDIFRINLLNLISAQSQKQSRRTLRVPPKTLDERVIRFFESHCIRPAGEKIFHIKMSRIAEELNDSRLDISRALNRIKSKGGIELGRCKIHIPALEQLINH